MSYALENEFEAKRLEKQSTGDLYSIEAEIKEIEFVSSDIILDAGCGSGAMSRFIAKKFSVEQIEACDISELRIEQAKKMEIAQSKIKYFPASITQLPVQSNYYSKIISRYVFEHLESPVEAAKELFRVLGPNGVITVIDADGIIFDLATSNQFVTECLSTIKQQFKFNMYIGRNLPQILEAAGFKHIKWNIYPMVFKEQALKHEFELNKERFNFIRPSLNAILGEDKTEKFIREYLEEMMRPTSVLFYNKFIVEGRK